VPTNNDNLALSPRPTSHRRLRLCVAFWKGPNKLHLDSVILIITLLISTVLCADPGHHHLDVSPNHTAISADNAALLYRAAIPVRPRPLPSQESPTLPSGRGCAKCRDTHPPSPSRALQRTSSQRPEPWRPLSTVHTVGLSHHLPRGPTDPFYIKPRTTLSRHCSCRSPTSRHFHYRTGLPSRQP